jgi:MFS superfamily sulfate permease-like transporter
MPGHRAGFGDLSRHDDAEPIEGLLIVRLDAPLYYFNANVARSQILELVDARQPKPRGVLIDLAATADLDVTTSDMLLDLVGNLRARSIPVLLAQVKTPVRERLRKTGLMDEIGEAQIHASVGSAVLAFEGRSTADPGVAGDETDPEPDPGPEPDPARTPGP